ncbi:MAG TPA: rhodanese-related sulfurtransferase [Acidimicrobiales bacterium]|nr:rhodanese-related sulfurtransferase [Acidimicrobiales bacterium]
MRPQKIILFYEFTPLDDPDAIRLWQRTLCEKLSLKGRILISHHGINGTLGGDIDDLRRYVAATKEFAGFRMIDFKWSEGSADDFPRLRVRVRDEVVSFGATDELTVDHRGVVGGGDRLSPQEIHELVERRGDDVVFFDARNAFEAEIGRFKDAVIPRVRATRDFATVLDSGCYDHLKHKAVVTYCTGGVRCEVLSALMIRRGFQEVYQLDGGIVRYGEAFGDDGLWEGSLYLFDARMHHEFSDHSKVLGACERCAAPTSQYHNCANLACRKLILLCRVCEMDNVSTNCAPHHLVDFEIDIDGDDVDVKSA